MITNSKKIDLKISEFGEFILTPNPDNGNYLMQTYKIEEANRATVEDILIATLPEGFNYERLEKTFDINHGDLVGQIELSFDEYIPHKKPPYVRIYINNDTYGIDISKGQLINGYNLLNTIYHRATEKHYTQLRFDKQVQPLLDNIKFVAEKMFPERIIEVVRWNSEEEYHRSDNRYVVKVQKDPERYNPTRYLFDIKNEEIIFVGQYIEGEIWGSIETISEVEYDVNHLTYRLDKMKELKNHCGVINEMKK